MENLELQDLVLKLEKRIVELEKYVGFYEKTVEEK